MNESPLRSIHEAAGARLGPPGPEALLTYGDVPAEYAAATESAVLFDETERGLVTVRAEHAQAFLHRLLANDVLELRDGEGNRNLLLTPKGKIRFDFDLLVEGDVFRLSTPPGEAEGLAEALEMYHFSEAVEIADETAAHAPITVLGPRSDALLRDCLGLEIPARDHARAWSEHAGRPISIVRLPRHGSSALCLDAGPEGAVALWRAATAEGARPAGRVVADILRVEAGAARSGEDIDESVYPQEARLEAAFSLDKGCYIGQEVVAKIDTYGGLNKRLVALSLADDDPVPRGTRLMRQTEPEGEWRDLGVVTSWTYSFVLDAGLALAYVKRRNQAVGTRFRLGEGPREATVVSLPVRPDALPLTGEFE